MHREVECSQVAFHHRVEREALAGRVHTEYFMAAPLEPGCRGCQPERLAAQLVCGDQRYLHLFPLSYGVDRNPRSLATKLQLVKREVNMRPIVIGLICSGLMAAQVSTTQTDTTNTTQTSKDHGKKTTTNTTSTASNVDSSGNAVSNTSKTTTKVKKHHGKIKTQSNTT